jgi:predicted permease
MVMIASEFPLVQPHLYEEQIPPVVYLSGILMFVAGLTIVRWHNLWQYDWTLLVTLCGWFFLALGLFRMFAAGLYQQMSGTASSLFFMMIEGVLFIIGLLITWKAYAPDTK